MENMKVSIPEYDIIEFNLKLTPYQLFHSCCDGSNCDDYSMMEMHADFLIILELLSHKILHIKIWRMKFFCKYLSKEILKIW